MSQVVQNDQEISINPLIYYQKPAIGSTNSSHVTPIQFIFPSGGYGIGIPPRDRILSPHEVDQNNAVIVSGPEMNGGADEMNHKRELMIAFLCLAIFNLVITVFLFVDAATVDESSVESRHGPFPSSLERIKKKRSQPEIINFICTITTLVIGSISVIIDSSVGLSIFALSTVLSFLLGTLSIPYFLYSVRYVFDVGLLYIGLVYRSRIIAYLLPMYHIRRR